MRFTIPTIAIAAATFAATLTFAPVIASVTEHFTLEQAPVVSVSAPAQELNHCPPAAKIVAALSGKECL